MIKVGVSACVVGDKVRFDGGHKRSGYVDSYLRQVFKLVPVCPEMGIGMGTPRPAIRLIEVNEQIRLVDSKDSELDYTDQMAEFYQQKQNQVAQLDGYIMCAKSPTCGIHRIKVYSPDGDLQHRQGQGVFTKAIKKQFPLLPMEEDGRLNDAGLRECFVTKVYVHNRFRESVMAKPSVGALVAFHSIHKYLVMAYSPRAYQELGKVVANAKHSELTTILKTYLQLLMNALSKPTDRKKHTNVLMHIQGYFKRHLSKQDKQELVEQIERYRLGFVPLMAPVTLLQHHLKHYPNDYLASQVYLTPYPEKLGLRA